MMPITTASHEHLSKGALTQSLLNVIALLLQRPPDLIHELFLRSFVHYRLYYSQLSCQLHISLFALIPTSGLYDSGALSQKGTLAQQPAHNGKPIFPAQINSAGHAFRRIMPLPANPTQNSIISRRPLPDWWLLCQTTTFFRLSPQAHLNIYMIQVVNSRKDFIFNGEMPAHEYVIAVFGSQSSGKSTLLNALFQTEFRVLDVSIQRKQCTQGIWLQNVGNYNIVDTEGSDSMDQDDPLMEHYVALFGFSISDLFIVNMWDNEIGRYDGGHFSVIRNIFRSALEVQKSSRKIVLFAIKDTPKDQNRQEVQKIMENDLALLWNKVLGQKPGRQRERLNVDKYFQFQFFFMSHYNKYRQKYTQEAVQLRQLIDTKIKTLPKTKKVPLEELPKYYENIWEKIVNNEQINLLNEKRLILVYCCQRVKAQCLQALQRILKLSTSFQKNLSTYKKKAQDIAIRYYKENTSNLDPQTSQVILRDLQIKAQDLVQTCFREIQQRKSDQIINSLKRRLQAAKKCKDILLRIQQGKEDALQQYRDFLEYTKVIEPFVEQFKQKLEAELVVFYEYVNRQSIQFEKVCEESMKQSLVKGIQTGTFSGIAIQDSYKQMTDTFKFKNTKFSNKQTFKELFTHVLNTYFGEIVLNYVRKSANFRNPFGNQQTATIHFQQIRQSLQKYLQLVDNFVDLKEINFRGVQGVKTQSMKFLNQEQIRQVQKYRQSKVTIPKTHLMALMFFAYSEFSAILVMLSIKKGKRFALILVYIILALLILRKN